jgi:predicted helicase
MTLSSFWGPLYSGTSYNVYDRVSDYRVPTERARNWLQNDYVKFIRWAEWKVAEYERGGYQHGIVAFITDNSYLRAPLFRGMRKHLLDHFSYVYILNLHGNTRFGETRPAGVAVDQNVFDIQQGVAIALLVKLPDHAEPGKVFVADLWGDRASKYAYLTTHDLGSTDWQQLNPEEPSYFFVERDVTALASVYGEWPAITTIFPLYSQAIVTARDHFVYAPDAETVTTHLPRQTHTPSGIPTPCEGARLLTTAESSRAVPS